MDRDDERIAVGARTALYVHGARTPWSVVLFHGLTNHPGQFIDFAPQLYVLGVNVVVPRMPLHGYADRMTDALAGLTAEMLVAAAYESLDAAAGLGDRVAVLGISMGGLLCAHIAQYRADVDKSVPVAPDFGLLGLSRELTDCLCWLLLRLPNMFLWWDPRVKEAQRPATAYPRFATHALMQTLRIGNAVSAAARTVPAAAQQIVTAVNPLDPAVNNHETYETVESWRRLRASGVDYDELSGLPKNHDIIDPDNPLARTDIVYPKLIELLTRTP
ncbi:MAG TPA: alpha/beta fold hydrolase [Candidatus Acidoferrales bacterium]|nr:alpha/beta fold hydrolase [Candidatus Acidoferrales bacterium]